MEFFAYIDPGTGSVLIQAILGVVLAGTVIFRSFLGKIFFKIKTVFTRKKIANEE